MGPRSKNIYSIRAVVQGKQRDRQVGGPWRPTLNEAVLAFVDSLKKKGQANRILKRPMVARRATIEEQLGKNLPTDRNGISYRYDFSLDSGVASLLAAQGMTIGGHTSS
jgi:hypothetical protein